MDTIKKQYTKKDELDRYIDILKANGFKIAVSADRLGTWCYFSYEDKLGYVQYIDGYFGFSTVHKPNRVCGTGFGMDREVIYPTLEMAHSTLVKVPHWASRRDTDNVNKYESLEEYVEKSQVLKYEII